MTDKLLPCPFCGGPAGEVGLEFVTCLSAEIGAEQVCPGKQIRLGVEDAERWNVRSAGDRCHTTPMTPEQFDRTLVEMENDRRRLLADPMTPEWIKDILNGAETPAITGKDGSAAS